MLTEISLEIEDPGAATKVAEEGAITIQGPEYQKLVESLKQARAKPANKLGEGGFEIEFVDPATFENTLKIVEMADATDEVSSKIHNFNMADKEDTQKASITMASALEKDQGVVIVDS